MKLREACAAYGFDLDGFLAATHMSASTSVDTTYVYLIACSRYVKIGIARDVAKRLANFQVASPLDMTVVHCREITGTRYAFLCERAAHKMLADYAHRGEWFTASKAKARLAIDTAVRATLILRRKHEAIKLRPVNDNVAAHVFPFSPMARSG
jgi:hypothetical protein